MTDIQHTSTPWIYEHDSKNKCFIIGPSRVLCTIPYLGYISKNAAEANAEFISKACNNHDALVEALELIMDNLGWVAPVNGLALMPSETFIKIKKVLEQAKE